MPYLIVMIKNVIFDMGQVLVRFDLNYFIEKIGVTDLNDQQLLLNELYKAPEWLQMDRGTLSTKQGCEIVCKRLPQRLHGAVAKLTYAWDRPILPVEGMAELIKELKEKNYKIYLLSNANDHQPNYWDKIPGSEYFDGKLVSYEVKLLKPEKEIYNILLNKFSLKNNECVFIDDSKANCDAAKSLGIESIVFNGNTKALRNKLIELKVL